MRRKDREMSKDFALEVADKCEYAVLSMTDGRNAAQIPTFAQYIYHGI